MEKQNYKMTDGVSYRGSVECMVHVVANIGRIAHALHFQGAETYNLGDGIGTISMKTDKMGNLIIREVKSS